MHRKRCSKKRIEREERDLLRRRTGAGLIRTERLFVLEKSAAVLGIPTWQV